MSRTAVAVDALNFCTRARAPVRGLLVDEIVNGSDTATALAYWYAAHRLPMLVYRPLSSATGWGVG